MTILKSRSVSTIFFNILNNIYITLDFVGFFTIEEAITIGIIILFVTLIGTKILLGLRKIYVDSKILYCQPIKCESCNGKGISREYQNAWSYGHSDDGIKKKCDECNGKGKIVKINSNFSCNNCHGVGMIKKGRFFFQMCSCVPEQRRMKGLD